MLKQTTAFRTICAAALIALAGLLASCGSDDDSTNTTEATQAKASFIKAADVICIRENTKIRTQTVEYQEEHGSSGTSPKKQEELIRSIIIPAMQNQVEGLAELAPPSQDQAEAEAFIAQFEEVVDAMEENPRLVLQQAGPFQELREAGQAFGFKACGQ